MTTGQMIATAAAAGARVAADWRRSVDSLINVCVGIRSGVLAFEEDKALLDAFLAPLIECGVLTADEARLGRSGSKLSMFFQIGEHAQLLRCDEVSRHLLAGYTLVYQICVIYKNLPGGERQKVQELARILAECPQDRAREYLLGVTRQIKHAAKSSEFAKPAPCSMQGTAPNVSLRDLIASERRFDLLLVTPNKALPLLDTDYPIDPQHEGSMLERCLPVHELLSEEAAAVVVTRICDFPIVATRLLPLCGFARAHRVLRVDVLTPIDVTEGHIIVTAKRGKQRLVLPQAIAAIDPTADTAIAAELFPDTTTRLHLFAPGQRPGWTSLVGDDSWLERPSLK
jgi:hypothetical protein